MKGSLRSSRGRWLLVGVLLGMVAAGGAMQLSAAGSDGTSSYVPITPCRLMDTRTPGAIGPRSTPIGAGETYSPLVWGTNGNCTIPATATAVSMNVTFVNPTASGFVTVFPPDQPLPNASNLNFIAGQAPGPNAVTSPLSFDGKIGFFNAFGTVNLIADIVGYYEQSGSAPGGIVSGNCSAILRWDLPECEKSNFTIATNTNGVGFDGSYLWVANYSLDTVSKINPATGAKVDFPAGNGPHGVAFDGSSIWVPNLDGDTVSKFNPVTGARVDFPAENSPYSIAFDGSNIWVTNYNDDTVSKFNITTGAKTDFPVGDGPRGVAYDGTNIWVVNRDADTASRINPATGAVTLTPATGNEPQAIAFDGSYLWIVNAGAGTVSKMNPVSGAKTDHPTGSSPWSVAFDGTNIWVANFSSDSVNRFDIVANLVIFTTSVGDSPNALAFDGSNMWVANTTSGTLTKLVP